MKVAASGMGVREVAALCHLLAGCGGDSDGAVDIETTVETRAVMGDAESDDAESDVRDPTPPAAPGRVGCGDRTCASESQWCCVVGAVTSVGFEQESAECVTDETECTDERAALLQCDEPADCPTAARCCQADSRQFCAAECPPDALQLCELRGEESTCLGRCYVSGTSPGSICVVDE